MACDWLNRQRPRHERARQPPSLGHAAPDNPTLRTFKSPIGSPGSRLTWAVCSRRPTGVLAPSDVTLLLPLPRGDYCACSGLARRRSCRLARARRACALSGRRRWGGARRRCRRRCPCGAASSGILRLAGTGRGRGGSEWALPRGSAAGAAPSAALKRTRGEPAGSGSLGAALRRTASSVPPHRPGPRCSPPFARDEYLRTRELAVSFDPLCWNSHSTFIKTLWPNNKTGVSRRLKERCFVMTFSAPAVADGASGRWRQEHLPLWQAACSASAGTPPVPRELLNYRCLECSLKCEGLGFFPSLTVDIIDVLILLFPFSRSVSDGNVGSAADRSCTDSPTNNMIKNIWDTEVACTVELYKEKLSRF